MYHKLIITLLLFCSISFGQSGKSVLTQAQKDSINAMIESYVDTSSNGVNYKTFEYYGAVGDGITNDSAAVVNALKSGLPVKGISGKTYLINNASIINIEGYDIDLSATGNKPFTIKLNNNVNGFWVAGTEKASGFLLNDSVAVGTKKLVLTSVADVDTGDLIFLYSPVGDYWAGVDTAQHTRKSDLHLVTQIRGDTVYLKEPTWDCYDAYNGDHPSEVYIYSPITVKMKNVVFEYANSSDTDLLLLMAIGYSKFDRFENVTWNYGRYTNLSMTKSYGSKILNSSINYADYAGLGYGIYLNGCFDVTIKGSNFNYNRSGVDGGTYISRSNSVIDNSFTTSRDITSSRGFGVHAQSENWIFENNKVYNGYDGCHILGAGHLVRGNRFYNIPASPILLTIAKNITVDGNILDIDYPESFILSSLPICFVRIASSVISDENSYINIFNNFSNKTYESFVQTDLSLYHLNVFNNAFNLASNTSYLIKSSSVDTLFYSNIRNNIFIGYPNNSMAGLSNNLTYISSYTEFKNPASSITSIEGGVSYSGSLDANGVDLDSLANITSVFNVSEDLTASSQILNGECEGAYTAGVAPNVTAAGSITASEQTGVSGKGQGFTSATSTSGGNLIWKNNAEVTAGTSYKLRFYAKRISGGASEKINVYVQNNFYAGGFLPTTSFQEFEFAFTPTTTISTNANTLRFGNYDVPDTQAVFVIDSIQLRPLSYETSITDMLIDSTISFTQTDSLPYLPTNRVKIANVGGELKAKDASNNDFILTNFPPVTIPSDSTGLPAGAFYFRSSDGILRRKY